MRERSRYFYSIGHGSRTIDEFVLLLKNYGIRYLIDVRSIPYSKFHPQFNQAALKDTLNSQCITYVFMGDNLGGRPKDPSCYNAGGKVDYGKVRLKHFFQEGIERLKTAYEKKLPVAIMCSERKPCDCHRAKLIGTALSSMNICLDHIDEKGKLKDQSMVMNERKQVTCELGLFNLP